MITIPPSTDWLPIVLWWCNIRLSCGHAFEDADVWMIGESTVCIVCDEDLFKGEDALVEVEAIERIIPLKGSL